MYITLYTDVGYFISIFCLVYIKTRTRFIFTITVIFLKK